MSPYWDRLKTPEEIELGRKREELEQAQETLRFRNATFMSLKAEIRSFEQVYEQVLGCRIHQLEDLEWQLKGLLDGGEAVENDPTGLEETFAQFSHRTDLLDEDDAEASRAAPQKSLKSLYREVAKMIHPDLAADDDERSRRQELMAVANHAYEHDNRKVLEDILAEWEAGPEGLSGADVAVELVRVIRLIARAQQNIHGVMRQIEELKNSDIYRFKLRVDEATADGIDLMAEMAATVDMDIAKARKRLAVLQGSVFCGESNELPPETRLIRFPVDQVCGTLYERNAASVDYRDWQRLGVARGIKEIFLDKAVRLDVKGTAGSELRFLEGLQSDDLQALFLHDVDDEALVHLRHLAGLQELYLSNTTVTSEGLRQLQGVLGLRRLYIYHTAIGDEAIEVLSGFKGLKWLTCSGTGITGDGLTHLRQVLPGCKAVSFEWRHGK